MRTGITALSAVLLATSPWGHAQQEAAAETASSFEDAAAAMRLQLEESIEELDALRGRIADEKIPLARRLGALEEELSEVRLEYQQVTRLLDSRSLDLTNLRSEIEARGEETTYLSNLLGEYVRNLESRLHIAEIQRYEAELGAARLAPENDNLSRREVFEAQTALLETSLDRLFEALGGTRFEGAAVDPGGLVEQGTFALVGPAALFLSADGESVGTAEERLGSQEPALFAFARPEDARTAAELVRTGDGRFPLDPTLGNAHKIEATEETLVEHVRKGGPVMWPIFALAAAALLVALFKWIELLFVRKPSRRRVQALLESVADGDRGEVAQRARAVGGPTGRMLVVGAEHLAEPRELIEESMYETVLTTRLKLQRFLPFIAISAASAPLLGLLGTVTGIINTFKRITVFGSGDVKTLSGGISEALITTEFGLIVAIPSLLLHAFLSRKARGVVDRMEKTAVAFLNQVDRTRHERERAERPARAASSEAHHPAPAVGSEATAREMREILADLLAPVVRENMDERRRERRAAAQAAADPSETTRGADR